MKMHLTLCCLLSIWVCFADHEHTAVVDQVETNAAKILYYSSLMMSSIK